MKLLVKNIAVNLSVLDIGSVFLHMKSKAYKRKNKLNLIKFENFYASKNTIRKMKRLPKEWKKIFSNHILIRDSNPDLTQSWKIIK